MNQVLTPTGYRDIADLAIGDPVSAFDMDTGAPIVNYIERIERWQSWLDGVYSWDCADDSEIGPQFSPWTFYLINGTRTLFNEQSIWRNGTNVCHVRDLVIGDTIYDDADNPIVIVGIAETAPPDVWYRFEISGDHSYIADGLTVHNASRFAVNAGNVAWTWDLSATTHWSALSGGSAGASAPGSADTVTFDGASGGNVVTPSYGGTGTFQSITCGAFTGTIDWSTNNNSITLSGSGTSFNNSGSGTRTIKGGSGTLTISAANGVANLGSTATGLTLDVSSLTIDFTGTWIINSSVLSSLGIAYTLGTLKISGSHATLTGLSVASGTIITNLIVNADLSISISANMTIANITQAAGTKLYIQMNTAMTLTLTNAPTLQNGSGFSAMNTIVGVGPGGGGVSLASGTLSLNFWVVSGVAFSGGASWTFNKSIALAPSTGCTINPPKYISRANGEYLAAAA